MPLTLADYTNWAANNARTAVAVASGGSSLEQASNQVGRLAHLFNRTALNSVRSTAMADFTRALTARFGASLARDALAEAGLTPTSKLEGRTILDVVHRADVMRVAALSDMTGSTNLSIVPTETVRDTILRYDQDQALHTYSRQYLELRALAVDALGEMPLDEGSYADFCERAGDLVSRLRALANGAPANVDREFRDEAFAFADALGRKVDQLEDMLEGKPLSEEGVQAFKDVWHDTVRTTLRSIQKAATKASFRTGIDAAIAQVLDNPQASFDDRIPVSKDAGKDLAKVVYDLIRQFVPKRDVEIDESRLPKLIAACYRQTLNERPWPVVDKSVDATIGGRPAALRSVIVPGARIGAPQGSARGPIGAGYDARSNGYMCHCANTSHAVNLAVSSMTVAPAPGQPAQLAFRGVRHGVHCAWEIDDPARRAAANESRAKETVIAAYLANQTNAIRATPTGTDPQGRPVVAITLDMVSVSLLTPDLARHAKHGMPLVGGGAGSDERLMLQEQKAAWDAVARNGVEFWDGQRVVRITPRITTFNFGVNAGAVKWSGTALTAAVAGGWGPSDELNAPAFAALDIPVRIFTHDLNQPQATRDAVRTLYDQCRQVLEGKGERIDSGDAYKVAARIAVLSHLMGWTPCWNCKSGKDRTGQMDVECKFLGALIARGEPIPAPGAPLTPEQKSLFRSIALEGGNFEIQKLNTGFAGFKTGGVSSIPERLGGAEYRQFHKGGSEHVGV